MCSVRVSFSGELSALYNKGISVASGKIRCKCRSPDIDSPHSHRKPVVCSQRFHSGTLVKPHVIAGFRLGHYHRLVFFLCLFSSIGRTFTIFFLLSIYVSHPSYVFFNIRGCFLPVLLKVTFRRGRKKQNHPF